MRYSNRRGGDSLAPHTIPTSPGHLLLQSFLVGDFATCREARVRYLESGFAHLVGVAKSRLTLAGNSWEAQEMHKKTMVLGGTISYLLIGGLDALGCAVPVWIPKHGTRNFISLPRRAGPDPKTRASPISWKAWDVLFSWYVAPTRIPGMWAGPSVGYCAPEGYHLDIHGSSQMGVLPHEHKGI
ncbi:hypothetical protein EDB80DRAFT_777589 [Ilyonectria destructans]|nr:hypothetical protein EDB80DRAFT_777589 [Ilyonectria destructans]